MKSFKFLVPLAVLMFALPAYGQSDDETCLDCHYDEELEGVDRFGEMASMFVTLASVDSSVHSGFACIDCHTDLDGFDDYPHEETLARVDCSSCHDEVAEVYSGSAHGAAVDNPRAATCASCHGKHNILPHTDSLAMTSAKNLPMTCADCHHKRVLTSDPDVHITDAYDRYMRGVHADGISVGIAGAATCSDCHGIHDLWKASDPRSRVYKLNVPKTCAQCHNDVYIKYARGIHGKALAAGINDSPNCSDCHGEHQILQPDDPNSPVNASNLSDWVCGRCHNDPRMTEKYGMGSGLFTSYQDSYHGLAVKGGSLKAATCVSCHKAHDVLPQTNPASSIHTDNLTVTCQKCHPKANDEFAASYTHKAVDAAANKPDTLVRNIYIFLIIFVIGGMILHNLLIVVRHLIEKYRRQKANPGVQRFNGNMIFQHLVLLISFIVLAITGFALRYPDAWWAPALQYIGIFESTRSVIHRVAAVIMLYISVHHTVWVIMTRRGRDEITAIFPAKNDLSLFIQNMKYHLGMTDKKPQFDRYDYTEKAEYWALVWGTLVMVATGFILWWPTFYTTFLPSWVVKIAETVHLYEAWLATLAIVFFHFFFVIYHPDQYPMSLTWLHGKMPEEQCEHHHPMWHERLAAKKAEEAKAANDSKEDDPKREMEHH